ncbi:MAG: cystathionine gamma-synthase [candidate division Zixibacteria bacterium]
MNEKKLKKLAIATRAVHLGSEPDPQTGAVTVPIYQTSTYRQEFPGQHKGYEYSRTDNPTRSAYQRALAGLEGADYGLTFASGMSAVDTIMKTYRPGDHIIAGDDLYGGVYRLFSTFYEPLGIELEYVDMFGDFDLEPHIKSNTKMVWMETPSNPLLKIADIENISKVTRAHRIPLIIDNTFMSPAIQQPLQLGANVIVHSTTKYIGGHSDTVGGAIITSDEQLYTKYKILQNSAGAVPGPFDCFIAHRGLKTLDLRMKKHCRNALKIADWLQQRKDIAKVIYPFIESHPHYKIAQRQMSGGGGMISFEISGNREKALEIVSRTELFLLAESLGGVESLIEHPAVMTHASIPQEIREEKGLNDRLIRLSVGIEDADDLIEDLDKALG